MRRPFIHLLLLVGAVTSAALCGPAAATIEPPGITVLGSGYTGEPFLLGDDVVLESHSTVDVVRDYALLPQPTIAGWLDHGATGWWQQVVADGGLGVAIRDPRNTAVNGFCVLDLADPHAPAIVSQLSGMDFDSVWLHDGAATFSSGTLLVTYDLAQPSVPVFTAANVAGDCEGGRWFSAVGSSLYFVDHAAALGALDVSDPRHPAPLATIPLAADRLDAVAAGPGVVYGLVATGAQLDLVTWDVAFPAAPVEVGRRTLGSGAGLRGLALVSDGQLLLASASDGVVRAFGLATPAAPAPGWTLARRGDRLVLSDSRIFVREGADLYVYERTAFDVLPAAPVMRSDAPELSSYEGRGPVLVGQLDEPASRLVPIDVSDPLAPRVGAPLALGGGGLLAYAGGIGARSEDPTTCRLLDLNDPTHPVLGAAVQIPGAELLAYDLLSPRLLYIAVGWPETQQLMCDVSDPLHPGPLVPVPDSSPRFATDRYLLCGDIDNLRLWDIQNLTAPVLLGTLDFPGRGAGAMQVWADHAYVATSVNGQQRDLRVFDLSDPTAPVQVAALPRTTGARRLDLHGNRLYVSEYRGFSVYDLADPGQPELIGTGVAPYNAVAGFGIAGNVTFITAWFLAVRNDGLSPAAVPRPAAPVAVTLAPAWPNPCNPATSLSFTLDAERELALSVYDIRGRHVTDVTQGLFAAGAHEATWNGTDTSGASVAAGVYLLRLHGAGVEAATTVTLIK
jgi:hypothetical protein